MNAPDEIDPIDELFRQQHFDVEDLGFRADKLVRVPMAIHAPLHEQRRRLKGQRHLVNAPMTRSTADAHVNVDAVVEVDKTRDVVHPLPTERLIRACL